jgi:hypothetical protein
LQQQLLQPTLSSRLSCIPRKKASRFVGEMARSFSKVFRGSE